MHNTKGKDSRTEKPETVYSIVAKLRKMSDEQFTAFHNDPRDRPVGDIISYLFNHVADLLVMADRWDKENRGNRGNRGDRIAIPTINMAEARNALIGVRDFINEGISTGCTSAHWKDAKNLVDYLSLVINTPIRNCDRFNGDPERLHVEWFEWTGTSAGTNSDGTVKMTFADWLLEPWDGTEMFPKKAPMKGDR